MIGFGGGDEGDGNDEVDCPECAKKGPKPAITRHLQSDHGWSLSKIENEFNNGPFTEVSGPSAPASSFDGNPPYATEDTKVEDRPHESPQYTEVETETDLCDCDPEHKETQTVQRNQGGKLGPVGGQRGNGVTVIICTKCGERFYEEDGGFGPDILPGPGPL